LVPDKDFQKDEKLLHLFNVEITFKHMYLILLEHIDLRSIQTKIKLQNLKSENKEIFIKMSVINFYIQLIKKEKWMN